MSLGLLAALAAAGCGSEPEPAPPSYDFGLPPGFAEPWVPPDNPMSAEKVALGRMLFFDERLSGNGTMSCSSCHERAKGFADGKPKPTGSTGDLVPRNAMGLTNVAWFPQLTWGNPTLETLEEQALVPLFGELPVELGVTGLEKTVLGRLEGDSDYVKAFEAAFHEEAAPITFPNIVKAIASYERTLFSGNSPYDQYTYGGRGDAMSESALRGMDLFFSERLECYHCHSGVNFTTAYRSANTQHQEMDFQNTGLYNVGSDGSYPPGGEGLFEFTGDAGDKGKFRVPSLRNVELTAPYMHDGSIATLEEVMDHYAAGGRTITDGPFAGIGSQNPNKNPLVKGFSITPEEKADVIAFLKSLTDVEFVSASDPAGP
ncbi:methanobactin export MATE transporter MbnM [Polyangium sp. y55x31]|uniref:methanobactin export MATE transporter MbnM n=1 Tax=Polyangium sp. y55x31 TaxID=3042688 RepID=UPI0024824E2B|nr:methanobactin export MATE transporter MbnM [Polyangium sp. y55x31]MDI1477292.1 di-heme enzyme [Polyangium sp. y55x31]